MRIQRRDIVSDSTGKRVEVAIARTNTVRPREAHPNVSPSKPPKSSQKKINFWPRKRLIPLRVVTNVTKCHKIEHKMTIIPKIYPHL